LDQPSSSSLRLNRSRYSVWLFALTFLYFFFSLFVRFHIPIMLSGDQVFFWSYAHRIIHGEQPYRDFFQFTPPGADIVFAALFRIFGERLWITNTVVLILGLALTYVCLKIAEQFLAPNSAALATVLFAVPFYGGLLNATHHWFSVLTVLSAVLVLFQRRDPKAIVVAGILLGVASFFTQTRGIFALAGIAIWLAIQNRRMGLQWTRLLSQLLLLVAAFAFVLIALETPFIVQAGFREVWFQQVTFVRHHMVMHTLGLPPGAHTLLYLIRYLFPYLLLPVIYPIALVTTARSDNTPANAKLQLLAIVGACLFLEVAFSPNFLRLYTVAMPAVILLVWWTAQSRWRTRLLQPLLWVFVLGTLGIQLRTHWRTAYVLIDLPSGKAAVASTTAEKIAWTLQHTSEGDWMYQPAWPGVYFPMQLRNPAFLDEVTSNFITTEPEFIYRSICQIAIHRTQYVIWSKRLDLAPGAPADQLFTLRAFIHNNYRLVRTFDDGDEAWELQSSDRAQRLRE
jgi:hypothetical protein